ncbi:hypothetical protein AM493_09970 [Flavobacterium akiainvivens]|uniref:Uncharacterized protein n=1 Tax=Flavobacterium akiainvivens TaxID=1202724 RepID=A0A0M8MD55_9FLAO|nr:hypothetical protein [Flavobacterium akiainvivens]KOS06324.1 hypothetical protein AM493_09970 [Flavobacterium akiainvivens]SFQ16228.1 hypothetical protein SAMN05444144_101370 [Flavobacterium akiainvivens]
MIKKAFFLLLFCFGAMQAQTLPDSIAITVQTFETPVSGPEIISWQGKLVFYNQNGKFTSKDKKAKISKKKVLKLVEAIDRNMTFDEHFKNVGIDTVTIKNKPQKLLNQTFEWTPAQRNFILPLLGDIKNYKPIYEEDFYTGPDFQLTPDNRFKSQVTAMLYEKGVARGVTTNKSRTGYALPWVTTDGRENFNPALKKALADIIGSSVYVPSGKDLTRYIADVIIAGNAYHLKELAAETYATDIDHLRETFTVVKALSLGNNQYGIRLRTEAMLPNVSIDFYAYAAYGKLYPSDSLKAEHEYLVYRIQNMRFIMDYLKENPETELNINYYNNSAVNSYTADEINKTPELWKKHDAYVKELQDRAAQYPSGANNTEEKIKESEKTNCGCNLRLDKEVLDKAIQFSVNTPHAIGDRNGYSIWLLLPDDRILLYYMNGDSLLNFKYDAWGSTEPGIQYPCKVFDLDGKPLN